MWDKLIDLGTAAFKDDPQAKDRGQVQIDRILERRFEPCIALWGALWDFSQDAQAGRIEIKDVQVLSDTLNLFLRTNGILVSFSCLKSLLQLQSSIADLIKHSDDPLNIFLRNVYDNLLPTQKTANTEASPGLLMLLRDQVGANFSAASALL